MSYHIFILRILYFIKTKELPMNKNILTIILSITLLLTCTNTAYAYDKNLYTYSEQKLIAPNTTLTTIKRMTDVGWMQIYLISADISHEHVDATVLIPEYISQKSKLTDLAKSEANVVAGINGDFFDTTGQSTLGIVVKNGDYITSSIHDNRFFNYLKLKDGRSLISKINGSTSKLNNITSSSNPPSASIDITYKNKPYLEYNRAILFDKYWGEYSIGNKAKQPSIELIITEDTIDDIKVQMPPIKIPENGYIVSAVGTAKDYILSNFKVGDKVSITGESYLSNLEDAIGGGSQILKNGEVVKDFSLDISGRHPRSALGFSKDNKFLYLITVDGRHRNYTGMTQTELAYLMMEAGAYNAINLDGGGSSEMVVTSDNGNIDIINHPSDGAERPIHNGIGIVNTAPTGKPSVIQIDIEQDRAFKNIPIPINYKIYDDAGHRLMIKPSSIQKTISGIDYQFAGNTFIPLSSGTATISISTNGITSTKNIQILDEAVSISAYPTSISLDKGQSVDISLYGKDKNGYSAPLAFDDIKHISTDNLGTFDGNTFTALATGKGSIILSTDKTFVQIPVGIGSDIIDIYDFEQQKGHFSMYPDTVDGTYEEVQFSYDNTHSGTLSYDFTHDTATRAAYARFDKHEVDIPNNATQLGLQVYGDYGHNHQLRAKFIDTKGDRHTIDFAKNINWNGWQQVIAEIPSGISPSYLESIYIEETDPKLQDKGVIAFDNLWANVRINPPSIDKNANYNLSEINEGNAEFSIITDWKKVNDYTTDDITFEINPDQDIASKKVNLNPAVDVNKSDNVIRIKPTDSDVIPTSSLNLIGDDTIIHTTKSKKDKGDIYDHDNRIKKLLGIKNGNIVDGKFTIDIGTKKMIYNKEKIIPIFLKNDNAFLSRTNVKTGWQKLLSYADKSYDENGAKPLVIFLEMSPWFKNPLDNKLFYDTMDNLYRHGNNVILIYPDGVNNVTKENGITHIRYDEKDYGKYVFDIDTNPVSVHKVEALNYIAAE